MLLGACAVAAEKPAPTPSAVVLIVADREPASPSGFVVEAARGVRFTRAYTADPDSTRGREAVLSGRFPHAAVEGRDLPVLLGARCTLVQAKAGTGVAALWETLRGLERAGTIDDTLVAFTACRGGDDESWFEKSVHVPMMIQWPRRIRADVTDVLASGVDLAPTILALCGVAAPDAIQGRDLSATLLGSAGDRPESIYAEGRVGTADSWRMMVRGLDKLVFTPDLRILHLYNLGQDPEETTDLAREISEERKCDELRAIAADWRRRLSDEIDPSGLKRR